TPEPEAGLDEAGAEWWGVTTAGRAGRGMVGLVEPGPAGAAGATRTPPVDEQLEAGRDLQPGAGPHPLVGHDLVAEGEISDGHGQVPVEGDANLVTEVHADDVDGEPVL